MKLNISLDAHHIDTEEEAVIFINSYINNATAFIVNVSSTETEQDCTALNGSSKFHELR